MTVLGAYVLGILSGFALACIIACLQVNREPVHGEPMAEGYDRNDWRRPRG